MTLAGDSDPAMTKQTTTAPRTGKNSAATKGTVGSVPMESAPTASELESIMASHDTWFRPKAKGQDPVFGLTRPMLYALAQQGKIKTANIRKPGAIRGTRLFHRGSVFAYLERVAAETSAREVQEVQA